MNRKNTICLIKKIFAFMLVIGVFTYSYAFANINVVTSTPDLASIARAVGGNKVNVKSIARGYQDPHFVEPKPSFMLLLKRADLYFVAGMSLECGWSPPLEQGARNPKVMRGAPGYIDCSQNIKRLEVPKGRIDRSMGDVHPEGNPHYLLDPENGIIVSKTMTRAFINKDPKNKNYYINNRNVFIKAVRKAEIRWLKTMLPYKGLKVITYHKNWPYFARRFGIKVAGYIEPKPGISPSPAHVHKIIKLVKQNNVKIIMSAPYFDTKIPNLIAKYTKAQSLIVPNNVGALKGTNSYIHLFDYITRELSRAASKAVLGR